MRFFFQILFKTVLVLLLGKDLSAQQAEFETSFFFEDAAGNRDTIIIGADPTADELINSHLGEILLTEPWDNEFEVRVTTEDIFEDFFWFNDSLYLYNKKITQFFNLQECGYSTSVIFLFYTTHFPVTVTWDTSVWSIHDSDCYFDGSFFHHSNEILEPEWWTSFDWHYACLGYLTSYQFDTTHNDPYVGYMDSVRNVGAQFIYGLQLSTNRIEVPISPCQYVLGIEKPIPSIGPKFQVYPNPTSGSISISTIFESSEYAAIRIFNCQGIEVLKSSIVYKSPIYLESLRNGVYFVQLLNKLSHIVSTSSFIVAH